MQEIKTSANPFPGLRPFESTETHLFFGRDGQSEELLRRLKRTRFLAVVGTSGSGKSSLVRAGLLPALQGGLMASAGSDWRIAILRPGSDPIGNLARALSSPKVLGPRSDDDKTDDMQSVLAETTLRRSSLGLVELVQRARTKLDADGQPLFPDYENLLVVVDQFEELFRFKRLIEEENSKEDAAAFVKLLLEAVEQAKEKIYIVLTMRSDFLGDCAQFWELPEAINNGQYLIPRMTRDERREAIAGPVAVGQGAITEPLVNQLLNDVGDNPDQLPILQHALMRTWDYWLTQRRNGDPIDIPHYNAIGGMGSALSRHADEAYEELSDAQKAIAEILFKGLTEKGTDNREIRRPMEVQKICELTGAGEAEVIAVIEVFRREGRSFLMPPPTDAVTGASVPLNRESLIDISHESLIRNWERLKIWTEEEAQSARIYKRLAETAVLHKAGEEALMKDPALQVALDWREKNKPNAAWGRRYHPEFETAMSFLDASAAARDVEARERAMQQRKEVSYKRTKLVAFILAFSVLLALGSAVYAFRQGAKAERARIVAEQKTAEALEQRNLADSQRQRANYEAHQAGIARDEADEQRNEADKQRKLALEEQKKAEDERARAEQQAELARQNEGLAKAAQALALQQKARADAEATRANAEAAKNRQLLYPADINLAQQAYEAGNLERGRELLAAHTSATGDSPSFEWYYLWRLFHGERETLKAPDKGNISAVVSGDGKTLAVGAGRMVEMRNLSGGETQTFPVARPNESFQVGSLVFSPDGRTLAVVNSGSSDTSVKFFDTVMRRESGSLKAATVWVSDLFFTADGQTLITVGSQSDIKVWDYPSLKEKGSIGAEYMHLAYAVSPDGKMIVTQSGLLTDLQSSEERRVSVLLWDVSSRKPVGQSFESESVMKAEFSPDGKRLAIADGSTVSMWTVATGEVAFSFKPQEQPVMSLAFSPDGKTLVTGHMDGTLTVTNLFSSGMGSQTEALATLKGHDESIDTLSFTSDGKLLISVSNGKDGAIAKMWDIGSLIVERTPRMLPLSTSSMLVYSPDGRLIAAPANSDDIKLLDAYTFKDLPPVTGHKGMVWAATFSPDGKLLASASDDKTVRLWDVATRAQVGPPIIPSGRPFTVAFSPDSKLLATGSLSGEVKVWDVSTRKEVAAMAGMGEDGKSPPTQVAFSTDGKRLAIRRSTAIELWDAALSRKLGQVTKKSDQGFSMAVSPAGGVLAIGMDDGKIELVDDVQLAPLDTLKGHIKGVSSLGFSADGTRLVSGDHSGTVKLWDMTARRELLTLRRSLYTIESVALSPNGKTIATHDGVNNLRFWRAATEEEVAAMAKPQGGGN